jgi:hypothetical protein
VAFSAEFSNVLVWDFAKGLYAQLGIEFEEDLPPNFQCL